MGKEYEEEDQIASMREAFSLFDTDGDGKIAPSDLGIVMRSLGSNPTQSHLRHILERENLNSPFDFHRFLELMSKYMKSDDQPFESELRDAFRVLDKDSSGFVSVSDLRHILTNIGEKLDGDEFDEWIKEVDVGSDGRFQYEDFISNLLVK
ncbi:hypothetical protein BVRB_5g102070 [Beta vulgaris subsp. vulgaris]|uniref:probable calcium-binding protein CML13 n=1 Tax=Beta vulgaris subsp. vulgaris TaxID=3555 RepID=UPI00053F937A|nr:probable calcium-binding protein CML13 [Beta vulgaris subsp. vulgaris]KMT12266.1 hypothetical protein BVRB_5g102070 [Beta vulgaris subsp. vulgaris]